MTQSFSAAIDEWGAFYTFLGTSSATLLGLLFVALSLRLNIFHRREIADVRDLAFQTFADFLFVVLISLLFLVPDQGRIGIGLPLAAMGVVGIVWVAYLTVESARVNRPPARVPWVAWPYYAALAILHLGLITAAGALLAGRTGTLYWLAAVAVGLLVAAVLNAWILLSHAGTTGDSGISG